VREVSHEWEQLSKNKPLCMRKSEDVTNEEYSSFYKSLSTIGEITGLSTFWVESQLEFVLCSSFHAVLPLATSLQWEANASIALKISVAL